MTNTTKKQTNTSAVPTTTSTTTPSLNDPTAVQINSSQAMAALSYANEPAFQASSSPRLDSQQYTQDTTSPRGLATQARVHAASSQARVQAAASPRSRQHKHTRHNTSAASSYLSPLSLSPSSSTAAFDTQQTLDAPLLTNAYLNEQFPSFDDSTSLSLSTSTPHLRGQVWGPLGAEAHPSSYFAASPYKLSRSRSVFSSLASTIAMMSSVLCVTCGALSIAFGSKYEDEWGRSYVYIGSYAILIGLAIFAFEYKRGIKKRHPTRIPFRAFFYFALAVPLFFSQPTRIPFSTLLLVGMINLVSAIKQETIVFSKLKTHSITAPHLHEIEFHTTSQMRQSKHAAALSAQPASPRVVEDEEDDEEDDDDGLMKNMRQSLSFNSPQMLQTGSSTHSSFPGSDSFITNSSMADDNEDDWGGDELRAMNIGIELGWFAQLRFWFFAPLFSIIQPSSLSTLFCWDADIIPSKQQSYSSTIAATATETTTHTKKQLKKHVFFVHYFRRFLFFFLVLAAQFFICVYGLNVEDRRRQTNIDEGKVQLNMTDWLYGAKASALMLNFNIALLLLSNLNNIELRLRSYAQKHATSWSGTFIHFFFSFFPVDPLNVYQFYTCFYSFLIFVCSAIHMMCHLFNYMSTHPVSLHEFDAWSYWSGGILIFLGTLYYSSKFTLHVLRGWRTLATRLSTAVAVLFLIVLLTHERHGFSINIYPFLALPVLLTFLDFVIWYRHDHPAALMAVNHIRPNCIRIDFIHASKNMRVKKYMEAGSWVMLNVPAISSSTRFPFILSSSPFDDICSIHIPLPALVTSSPYLSSASFSWAHKLQTYLESFGPSDGSSYYSLHGRVFDSDAYPVLSISSGMASPAVHVNQHTHAIMIAIGWAGAAAIASTMRTIICHQWKGQAAEMSNHQTSSERHQSHNQTSPHTLICLWILPWRDIPQYRWLIEIIKEVQDEYSAIRSNGLSSSTSSSSTLSFSLPTFELHIHITSIPSDVSIQGTRLLGLLSSDEDKEWGHSPYKGWSGGTGVGWSKLDLYSALLVPVAQHQIFSEGAVQVWMGAANYRDVLTSIQAKHREKVAQTGRNTRETVGIMLIAHPRYAHYVRGKMLRRLKALVELLEKLCREMNESEENRENIKYKLHHDVW